MIFEVFTVVKDWMLIFWVYSHCWRLGQ